MPRTRRLVNREEKTAYHIVSRTALDGFPFGSVEKDELVKIIEKLSKLFFVEVFGFCFTQLNSLKKNVLHTHMSCKVKLISNFMLDTARISS